MYLIVFPRFIWIYIDLERISVIQRFGFPAGCGGLWRPVARCGNLWQAVAASRGPYILPSRRLGAGRLAGWMAGWLAGWLDGGGGNHHPLLLRAYDSPPIQPMNHVMAISRLTG